MKICGRFLVVMSLLVASCSLAVAQDKVEDLDSWLIRATTLTDDLAKDATSLTPNERALLWARIGKAWAKDDPNRAAASLRKAVEIVELTPDQENESQRRQRLQTAQYLLRIIPSQDSKLRLRLEGLFAPVENQPHRGVENAEGMVAAAMATVDTNPKRAYELGVASLRLGRTYQLASLLWRLRKVDTKLADGLFDQALAVAEMTFDAESLGWLGQYAFNGQIPSEERRKALLGVMAEGLLRNSVPSSGDAEVCKLAVTVAPLLNQFARLLPMQWGAVRAATQRCQASVPSFSRQRVDEALRDQPPQTVDDLESEADKARQENRDEYLTRAASLASEQKDFQRAILLLDRISDQGRKQLGGAWESWRCEYTLAAAVTHLKGGDRSAMYKVVAATPVTLRALVQIGVAQELVNAGDTDSAFELLSEARQRLAQSTGTNVVDAYFNLLRQYERLMPLDTLNVFNEAVKAINRSEKSDPGSSQTVEFHASLLSNDILLRPYNIPLALVEREETGVKVAISSIESASKRVAIRLNLLAEELALHRTFVPGKPTGIVKELIL